MLHAIVMAGGSGTRFWPRSRERSPKQLQAIGTERALVVETCARVAGLVAPECVHVITNAAYADQVRGLLPRLPADNIVGEPIGRDTAAAIGLAAERVLARDANAEMIVMPADHVIAPVAQFERAVRAAQAVLAAQPETLITFGIKPTYPATGFGYIKRGRKLADREGVPVYAVQAFTEKPKLPAAEEFLRAGDHYWNAGIFAWRAATIRALIERFLPELAAGLAELRQRPLAEIYPRLPKISIDYAILEKAPDRTVIEAPFAWDDVGSWRALERHTRADDRGNVAVGEVALVDASNNVIDARDGLVALIGVSDLVVVHTPDVTLVCPKERAEEVKQIIEQLKARGATHFL
jgi:mannose-1-phosphate guanylyltransferase